MARLLLQVFSQRVARYEHHGWIAAEGAEVLRDSARCTLRVRQHAVGRESQQPGAVTVIQSTMPGLAFAI